MQNTLSNLVLKPAEKYQTEIFSDDEKPTPFLRWAGGKRWLLKQLHNYLPVDGFNQYHEPFIGGGSIFFHLQPEKAFISDLNKELIDSYNQVCVVSPELHNRSKDKCWEMLLKLPENIRSRIMLCTDLPDKAKEFFYESAKQS